MTGRCPKCGAEVTANGPGFGPDKGGDRSDAVSFGLSPTDASGCRFDLTKAELTVLPPIPGLEPARTTQTDAE